MKRDMTRRAGAVASGIAALVALSLIAGFVSAPDAASASQYADGFASRLAPAAAAAKLAAGSDAPTGLIAAAHARSATAIAAPAPAVRTARTAGSSATVTRTSTAGSTASAPAAAAPAPAPSKADAQAILNRYIAKYPILAGATVSYGDAKGYQAICYYKSGRIVISTTHTRSLETIIGHEIWHIIDWRDNGVIDWGENVPPK